MLSKPLLWVSMQAGHSVEVMLSMYAKWIKGATEVDLAAIRLAMQGRPLSRRQDSEETSPVSEMSGTSADLLRRNPLESPEFGTSAAGYF
jgi:hypothetical protein